ncbi:hypothetical protein [Burkholderia sp. Ac-20353]|uniref:hypothetical protein n=1 Tax=Burkholderia sp. Ac-20353 TaxID=2703894 RepID=UPI00197C5890|nr:hypothetical protein [Burkholderia sp. Ac-20353]MBN3787219.1 hypothetical protein [Burkholderia sp. Ac-20353]
MSDDSMDLPARRPATVPAERPGVPAARRGGLTEQQADVLIGGGVRVAENVTTILTNITEIVRIRADSQAQIDQIAARSNAVREAFRAEVERLSAMRETIVTRGDTAVKLIREVLSSIPESDPQSRQQAMEMLTKMVEMIVADPGASSVPRS